MRKVVVERNELRNALIANRDNHRAVFERALEGYHKAVVQELERSLDDARAGREIRRMISLQEPKDHTKDYDRVIRMVEMSIEDELELDEHQFMHFVMDEWDWMPDFAMIAESYT